MMISLSFCLCPHQVVLKVIRAKNRWLGSPWFKTQFIMVQNHHCLCRPASSPSLAGSWGGGRQGGRARTWRRHSPSPPPPVSSRKPLLAKILTCMGYKLNKCVNIWEIHFDIYFKRNAHLEWNVMVIRVIRIIMVISILTHQGHISNVTNITSGASCDKFD